MQLIKLSEVRSLLARWDEVRRLIGRYAVVGFALALKFSDGEESILFGGEYERDDRAACRAILRMSWELTRDSGRPRP